MKSSRSITITIGILFIIGCGSMSSCDKLRDNSLIGRWLANDFMTEEGDIVKVSDGEEITITIDDDGFGHIRRGARKEDFRWVARFHRFKMKFHDKIVETCYYSLKNDSLILTFEDNDTYIFTPQQIE